MVRGVGGKFYGTVILLQKELFIFKKLQFKSESIARRELTISSKDVTIQYSILHTRVYYAFLNEDQLDF